MWIRKNIDGNSSIGSVTPCYGSDDLAEMGITPEGFKRFPIPILDGWLSSFSFEILGWSSIKGATSSTHTSYQRETHYCIFSD